MPRLSHAQDATRQRLAGLIAAGLTPDQFGCRLLEALETALPSDGARLLGIDPATLLVNRTIAASENDAWARGAWLREAYLASGPLTYIDFPTIMQAGLTAVAFHERQSECWGYTADLLAPVPERLHLHAFHENQAPVGGTLLASIPSGTADRHWIAALQIYPVTQSAHLRAAMSPSCGCSCRRLARGCAPHSRANERPATQR